MSFDDEFGGFLDRETMLAGGLPAKRANTLLFLIESRTAHLVAQSRQAMEVFLTREAAEERELAFLESFALGSEPPLRPTSQELERYAPQWASLVQSTHWPPALQCLPLVQLLSSPLQLAAQAPPEHLRKPAQAIELPALQPAEPGLGRSDR